MKIKLIDLANNKVKIQLPILTNVSLLQCKMRYLTCVYWEYCRDGKWLTWRWEKEGDRSEDFGYSALREDYEGLDKICLEFPTVASDDLKEAKEEIEELKRIIQEYRLFGRENIGDE